MAAWGSFATNSNPRRRVSRSFNASPDRGAPPSPPLKPGAPSQAPPGYSRNGTEAYDQGAYWGQQQGQGQGHVVPFYHNQRVMLYADHDEELDDLDRSRLISFASVGKIAAICLIGIVMSYLAVVPRTAPTQEYNYLFKVNILLLMASAAAPTLLLLLLFDGREVNVNELVSAFFSAFTWGYALAFVAEVVAATAIRLAAFGLMEPQIFDAFPDMPSIYLPWLWKDQPRAYRPRLSTLLAADVMVHVVACPLIEEAAKLAIYRWCARPKRRGVPPRRTVHSTLVYVVASALGLKTADNARRILLYTKPQVRKKNSHACLYLFGER
jgi:hypothetical protein